MKISDVIAGRQASDVITARVDAPVRDAVTVLAQKRIGALPVLDGDEVVGIFSERDVIYRMASEGAVCLDRKIADVMTSPAITVERETMVDQALGLMTKRRIRHLPVVDETGMCGFISIGDLVKSRMDEVQHEADAMRDYIAHA